MQENAGRSGAIVTYEDMLSTPHDEDLFDYYATAPLAYLDAAAGRAQSPVAPDHRPYSDLQPANLFPRAIEVWDSSGALRYRVVDLPLADPRSKPSHMAAKPWSPITSAPSAGRAPSRSAGIRPTRKAGSSSAATWSRCSTTPVPASSPAARVPRITPTIYVRSSQSLTPLTSAQDPVVVTGGTPFWWYLIPVVWAIGVTALSAYWARAGADCVRGYLGETGIRILTRVMGLMLTAIAVQFMINGWRTLGWSNQFTGHAPSVTMTCYATT